MRSVAGRDRAACSVEHRGELLPEIDQHEDQRHRDDARDDPVFDRRRTVFVSD